MPVKGMGFKGISVRKKVGVKLGARNKAKLTNNGQAAPKLTRQNALAHKANRTDISTSGQLGLGATAASNSSKLEDKKFWDSFGQKKSDVAAAKPAAKPEAPATPSSTEAPKRSLMDKILGRNKANSDATTAAGAKPDAAATPVSTKLQTAASFVSGVVDGDGITETTGSGIMASLAGSVVGGVAMTAIPALFSGGGGQAEQAPPPAPPAQQPQSPDPYAVGSYGVPGSLPNYI